MLGVIDGVKKLKGIWVQLCVYMHYEFQVSGIKLNFSEKMLEIKLDLANIHSIVSGAIVYMKQSF